MFPVSSYLSVFKKYKFIALNLLNYRNKTMHMIHCHVLMGNTMLNHFRQESQRGRVTRKSRGGRINFSLLTNLNKSRRLSLILFFFKLHFYRVHSLFLSHCTQCNINNWNVLTWTCFGSGTQIVCFLFIWDLAKGIIELMMTFFTNYSQIKVFIWLLVSWNFTWKILNVICYIFNAYRQTDGKVEMVQNRSECPLLFK